MAKKDSEKKVPAVETAEEIIEETTEAVAAPAEAPAGETAPAPVSHRYDKKGNRRGYYRYAPVVGLIMLLLSLAGLVAIVYGSVKLIGHLTDDTALRTELFDYVEPLVVNTPVAAFDTPAEANQDVLLLATFYRVTQDESIRMLVEKDDQTQYDIDEQGRLIVPIDRILGVWKSLFGDTPFPYKTVGEAGTLYGYECAESRDFYYLPTGLLSSMYEPLILSLKKVDGNYRLKIGLVPVTDLGYDYKGNLLDPTPEQVAYSEIYTIGTYTDEEGNTSRQVLSVEVEGI